jgi:3-hydroxypropanoate dehydrogenase
MKKALDDGALDILFREARSYNRWAAESVSDETLHRLYELLKFGPTSANSTPARFVFVKSAEAKSKLVACVSPGNVTKVEQAPVTVIIAMDEKFYEKLPKLFPQKPGMADMFKDTALAEATMMRNSSLQGAYLSGFHNAKVDAAFFAGTPLKSNFICALGTGTTELLFPRNPRLAFDEACKIV